MRGVWTVLLGLAITLSVAGREGQSPLATTMPWGTTLPATCTVGNVYIQTTGTPGFYTCLTPNTWTLAGGTGGGGGEVLPTGTIVVIFSGTCPAGYTESSALAGKTLVGMTAAAGDVGTTGGSDTITPDGALSTPTLTMNSYTPAGTVAAPIFTGSAGTVPAHTVSWPGAVPTLSGTTASFTGSALGTHAHELPFQIPSTTTTRQIAVATFGTGTSRAATAVSTTGTANTTSAAVALSQAVSAGTPAGTVSITSPGTIAWPGAVPTMGTAAFTPAGTVSAPSFTGSAATLTGSVTAPSFTGTAFDNRPAFARVIFCSKN